MILEQGSTKLSIKSMRGLIPTIQEMEHRKLKQELEKAAFLCLITDGTTDVCEMCVIIIRWLDMTEIEIQQRLVSCAMLKKSLTGDELSAQIHEIVCVNIQLNPSKIHCYFS